jgi:integrase
MSKKPAGRKRAPHVSDLFSEVLKFVGATLEPGTLAIYHTTFAHFRRSAGNPLLSSLTPRYFDRYKIDRLAAVAPSTVNIELRTLKSAFRMGVRWNMLPRSPLEGVSLARVPEREPAYYGREEFQRLLDTIREPWLRDVVLFAAVTGMRQGEILSLTWNQVDLGARVVRLASSASFKTKTGKRRTVPLGETALQVLRQHEPGTGSGVVFTLRGKPLMRRWVTTKLRRYVRLLDMDRRLNFHSLRHSFASWLAADGVSIYQISKLLGHSDVKITQAYYAHLEPGELHEVVDRITFRIDISPIEHPGKISPERKTRAIGSLHLEPAARS